MTKEKIKELNNETLLDILINAYIKTKDYLYRTDYIQWNQELENQVIDEYWNLYYEVLRRMNNEMLS